MTSSVDNSGVRIFTNAQIDEFAARAIPLAQQSARLSIDMGTQASAASTTAAIAKVSPTLASYTAPAVNRSFQSSATVLKAASDPLVAKSVQTSADYLKQSV